MLKDSGLSSVKISLINFFLQTDKKNSKRNTGKNKAFCLLKSDAVIQKHLNRAINSVIKYKNRVEYSHTGVLCSFP